MPWVIACGCSPSVKPADGYAGSESCRECHADAYGLWAKSNHGLAERGLQTNADAAAFAPARTFTHGSQATVTGLTNGVFYITSRGLSGQMEVHRVERVVGNSPLREFLVGAPGGRWQTLEAAYDPRQQEWFNVFGQEDRQPGEWGHWTGRGMNWNSMCAACHNTRLQKNYDPATDQYHTTLRESSVACEACHGPLSAHVAWEKEAKHHGQPDPNFPRLSARQTEDMCASCHARRGDLTGDFVPGDNFYDHFDLAQVDQSDLFYPDGQVRDEDYEYSAFLGSKMHTAGVTCLDCHPRSLHMPRPKGNGICLRCHATGQLHAPIIQPEQHSHHAAGRTGDECIGCHMPVTVYMQRHPRHDHGFTIPDPLLTQECGVPNACNRCHTGKDTAWALTTVDQWYGAEMNRPTRQRAEWVARARQGDASAREPLVALLQSETNAYWQAVVAGLLDQWIDTPSVAGALETQLANPHPLVRAAAARSLAPLADQSLAEVVAKLRPLLADPVRNVRIATAWALRADLDTNSTAGRDLLRYLDFNSDQPVGQLQIGNFYFSRGDLPEALAHLQKAVAWDARSAPLRRELAVVLSAADRPAEAVEQLETACQLAPTNAELFYALGLAWHEAGDGAKAMAAMERAVRLDPQNGVAWYNLGLLHNAAGDTEAALQALSQGERAAPSDPRLPYARATILAQTGQLMAALQAVHQALALQPNYGEALRLQETLSQVK
ncbi:MAG TPA: tetratricopeptide repeat protein [Candidatus Acidoferrales bacterium]|nr:tetratricopeptide repeat protein [Candidatus Acidoferrales bacterium]